MDQLAKSLGATDPTVATGEGWTLTSFTLPTDSRPIRIDILADAEQPPERVSYLLPSGAASFTGNFFTPREHNLAQHLRRHGSLVIGVTPRADALTSVADPAAADMGLAQHRQDLARVVSLVDEALGLPFEVLGHSGGAATTLDFAAHDRSARLDRIVVLDNVGPFTDPQLIADARGTVAAFQGAIAAGRPAMDTKSGLLAMFARPLHEPTEVPRAEGHPGNFTVGGFLHHHLIRTGKIAMPFRMIYHESQLAGRYTFAEDPAQDSWELAHTPLARYGEALRGYRSGAVPFAYVRDTAAVWAGLDEVYRIDFAAIRTKVLWLNMSAGLGEVPHGAELIRAGGNKHVEFRLVQGYGHHDLTLGEHADKDVWSLITGS